MSSVNPIGPQIARWSNSSTLAGSAPTTASDSLLPDPSSVPGGDPGEALAILMIELGKNDRKADRALERTADAVESREENAQVAALHEKANDTRKAGLIEGWSTVAAGALTIASGSEEAAGKNASAHKLDGASKAAAGVGKIWSSGFAADAIAADAEALRHEHAALHAKRAGDDSRDDVKEARELIKSAIDFYREYQNAEAGARSAALHRS